MTRTTKERNDITKHNNEANKIDIKDDIKNETYEINDTTHPNETLKSSLVFVGLRGVSFFMSYVVVFVSLYVSLSLFSCFVVLFYVIVCNRYNVNKQTTYEKQQLKRSFF